MNDTLLSELFLALLLNAALLLCLAQVFDLTLRRRGVAWLVRASPATGVVLGGVVGLVAILLISLSFTLQPGIIFDTRSVLLAISGLFLGPLPTGLAMAMAAIFRAAFGGPAAPTGVAVIVASGLIGLAWRRWHDGTPASVGWRSLLLLGLTVHVVMLSLMLLIPWPLALRVIERIALPVLVVHPLATLALGALLAASLRRQLDLTDLVEREAHYHGLFDNPHAAMLVSDPESGVLTDANPAAERFYGWSRKTLRGMRLKDLEQAAESDVESPAAKRGAPERTDRYLTRHRRADGSTRDVEVLGGPVELSKKRLVYSIVHDVTDRVSAEAAVAASAVFARNVIDSLASAVAVLDGGGEIVEVNDAWRVLVRRQLPQEPEDALVGSEYALVCARATGMGEAVAGEVIAGLLAVLRRERERFEREYEVVGPGARRWYALRATPLRGGSPGLVVSHQDVTGRVQADAERREAEASFRRLIENAPEALVLLDPESHKFTFANAAAERLFGLPAVELCRLGPVDLSPPTQPDGRASSERSQELVAAALAGESALSEWLHRDASGREIPCEVRLLRLEIRGRVLVRGSVLDISERKQAETRMRRLNRTYALLSEINQMIAREPEPTAMLDAACRIAVEVGGFALVWIGRTAAERRLRVVSHAGADATTLEILRSLVEGERPDCQFTYRALNHGERSLCRDIATDERALAWRDTALARGYRCLVSLPIRSEGRIDGTFNLYASEPGFFDEEQLRLLDGLAIDIGYALEAHLKEDRRKRAEQALRESEERFRLLIENAPDMIHVIDNRALLRFQSPSVEQHLGYSAEEFRSRSVAELVHPEDRAKAEAALAEVVGNPGQPVRVDLRVLHRDGGWRHLETVGLSLPGQDAEGFIVLNSRDATAGRQLEEQLRQDEKMKAIGQLAGGVAHDFNNLLTSMILQAELAAQEPDIPEAAGRAFREIRATAERASELTRALLLFSRKQVLQKRRVDLNETVGGLARMLQRIIGEDIGLPLRLHREPLPLEADPTLLEQAVLNLAVNARDAMPSGGRLCIETGVRDLGEQEAGASQDLAPGRYAVLRVSDSGAGIPPHVLPHIFEPFFTTKEPGKGTGLGLATVFGIVKQHNGAIGVESAEGVGTSFEILLPALAVSSAGESEVLEERRSPRSGSETILVVEDDANVRRLFEALLVRGGYRVIAAANGPEAELRFGERGAEIALLLTDLVMPGGMSGHELALRLREARPSLRVVYVSGYSPETAGRDLVLRPGESFLTKPLTRDQLLEAVRRCLDADVSA